MRKVLFAAIALLAVAFGAVAVVNLSEQKRLVSSIRGALSQESDRRRSLRYEFIAVLPGKEDPYYAEVAKTLSSYGQAKDAAFRFIEYSPGITELRSPSDPSSLAKIIASLAYLDVDGIVLSVPDSPALVTAIGTCSEAGIPVTTLGIDSPSSRRKAYIGLNAYSIGRQTGAIAARLKPQAARAVLVLPDPSTVSQGYADSLRQGFYAAAQRGQGFKVLDVITAPDSALAGENMVRGIVGRNPEVNVLVLTTPRDSMGAAQAIIDLNLVGVVSLIGVAESTETRNYVSNGVMADAIARDPELAGRRCVDTLLELKLGKPVSAFIDTGFSVLASGTAIGEKD